MSKSAFNRLRRSRRGATAVEFGLVGGLFFAMLLGCIEAGRGFFALHSLNDAVARALRDSLLNLPQQGSAQTCSDVTAQIAKSETMLDGDFAVQVCRSWTGANGTISVTGSYTFNFITPFFVPGLYSGTASIPLTVTETASF